jgi:hypothetical protein
VVFFDTALLDIIDRTTARRNMSRSKFISLVLREKLQEERSRHLKSEYDRVFSDKAICDALAQSQKTPFFVIPVRHPVKTGAESSKFNNFWIPPYQVRGRLIGPGITVSGLFTTPSTIRNR